MGRRSLLLVAALLSGVLFLPRSVASGHANLVRSEPAANAVVPTAPDRLILYFTEPPDLPSTEVRVFTSAGRPTEVGQPTLATPDGPVTVVAVPLSLTADGVYTVAWATVSRADGHPSSGRFAFVVGVQPERAVVPLDIAARPTPPAWLATGSRALTAVALAGLLGWLGFFGLAAPSVFEHLASGTRERLSLEARRGLIAMCLLLCLTAITAFGVQGWRGGHDPATLLRGEGVAALVASRFGASWLVRSALSLAALALALRMSRAVLTQTRRASSRLAVLWLVGLALAASIAVNSHPPAHLGTLAGGALNWLHYVAAGTWIGGLAWFLRAFALIRHSEASERSETLWRLVPRFSSLATACVLLLVGSGLVQWWVLVRTIEATLVSDYGLRLLVKLALIVPLLALGGFNLLVVRRALHARIVGAPVEQRFIRALTTEVLLGVAVVVSSSVLAEASPPTAGADLIAAPAAAVEGAREAIADGVMVRLRVTPARAGVNELTVDLEGSLGKVDEAVVRFTFEGQPLGTSEAPLGRVGDRSFEATTSDLSLVGPWTIEIIVRREHLPDIAVTFHGVDVHG